MSGEMVVKPDQAPALVAMIERVALSPEADMAKLEKLIDLQERVLKKQAEDAYSEAMAMMQGELPSIAKRGEAKGRYTYALWQDINEAIKPILQRYGFSLTFRTQPEADGVVVVGVLRHRGGHKEETSMALAPDTSGNKPAVQAMASAISYGKRYTAGALLNLTYHGEDDDAFAASYTMISEAQADEIDDLLKKSKADEMAFFKWIGANSLLEIPAKKYQQAVTMLKRKIQEQPHPARPHSSRSSREVAPGESGGGKPTSTPTEEEGVRPASEAPSSDHRPITEAQKKRLEARIGELKINREAIKVLCASKYGVEHFTELTRDQYAELDAELEAIAADLPE